MFIDALLTGIVS